tara:strand:+ start:795675 stop:796460 length:786 start_codon:yes stop_codon:yes gene_type:complete
MQHVVVKIHEQVATLLLDRADTCNALNPSVIEDLRQAISDVHQEKRVRAVVLTGSGEHFCSGLDLQVLREISELPMADAVQQWHALWLQLTELYEDVLRLPKPVIAAVDGTATGAGFGLALAADIIVPTEQATFCAVAVRRGLVGGATGSLLNFRAGAAVAARMLLTGTPVAAQEAYRLGLCCEPVDATQIWVAANEIAVQCSQAPREAVQATKRVLNESIGETLMMQLSATAADSAAACTTESATEGIRSYLESRDPQWP